MNPIVKRLVRLEERLTPKVNERQLQIVAKLRERRCRRLAAERNDPYEEVLRESLVEDQRFIDNYRGNGTLADVLRYSRRIRLEAAATRTPD